MIAVAKEQMDDFSKQVQKAGYIFKPAAGSKDRLFLRTEYPEDFTKHQVFHVHITYPESDDWKGDLAFCDYLRKHPGDLVRYAEIKKKAAIEANEDYDTYTKIKKGVLEEIWKKALE